jgi:hypothetical protein
MDSFAYELHRYRSRESLSIAQSSVPSIPQISRDFIGEHLLQAEAEEVGRVAALGSGEDVAPESGGSLRSTMTGRAAVGEAGAEGRLELDVADAVADARAVPLGDRELALEELAPALDRPERIALVLKGITGVVYVELSGGSAGAQMLARAPTQALEPFRVCRQSRAQYVGNLTTGDAYVGFI